MRILVAALVLFSASLGAQDTPYVKADPSEFLGKASAQKRPAVVLYNFNLESG